MRRTPAIWGLKHLRTAFYQVRHPSPNFGSTNPFSLNYDEELFFDMQSI